MLLKLGTAIGAVCVAVVPVPKSPLKFAPQLSTEPLVRTAML